MLSRLSLRARLLLGVVALAAVGLAIADVVTYSSLRSFLIQRTDSALNDAHQSALPTLAGKLDGGPGSGPRPGSGPLAASVPGDWIQLRGLDGSVIVSLRLVQQFSRSTKPSPPKLPKTIKLPARANQEGDRVTFFTVPATHGDARYRVRASVEAGFPGQILILAAPLTGVDSTLHRLLAIEVLVTGLVLVAIAALGLWVVRLSLRPLEAIAGTAAAIGAGDLSRRVERAEGRTEVGRLGLALNAMLGQIESATEARESSLRALESSERKLRRFVADASHELRTPLAAVRAYAELFSRGAATRPDDLARSMKGIGRESERMSVLVDDLLLLARLDEGRPLVQERVDLNDLVAEAVETAHAVDPARPIELDVTGATVLGDRDRLRQIVDNLLANVRAHTPPDTPVRVALSTTDGLAVIAVSDAGPGMDEEQVAHVFERFYRADPTRSRASGGAGLGLSIVAAVAGAHGGSVRAESKLGEGSTFRIELPLAPATP